jgi:hypothetical protein
MKPVVLAIAMLFTQQAQAGNEVGNGGDRYAQEFTAIARSIVNELKANPNEQIQNLAGLEEAVEDATIRTKDTVRLGGEEVDAVNFPQRKRIELSRSRWKDYNLEQKRQLVMHEILGLAGEDDQHYQISGVIPEESHSSSIADSSLPTGNASVASKSEFDKKDSGRFFLGLGGGINNFTGNIGKLYGSAGPSLGARVGFSLQPNFDLMVAFEKSGFEYTSAQTGQTGIDLSDIKAGARFKPWAGHMVEPFVTASLKHNFRSQEFRDLGQVMKDTALGYEAGLGFMVNVAKSTSLWLEGTAGSILFKDRYDATFENDGIADTTGMLVAANVGVQMRF